jgi:ADP-ribose pyrophosphatase YjhB (NUDIX family)
MILILKRAPLVHVNPGLWSPVSGRVERALSPERQALEEIREETGIEGRHLQLIRTGKKFILQVNPSVRASVQPYLFRSRTRRVHLNWENSKFRWVKPTNLSRFKLIPRFDLTLKALKYRE